MKTDDITEEMIRQSCSMRDTAVEDQGEEGGEDARRPSLKQQFRVSSQHELTNLVSPSFFFAKINVC